VVSSSTSVRRAEARLVARRVVGSGNGSGNSSMVSCWRVSRSVMRRGSRSLERKLTRGGVGSSVGRTLVHAVLVSTMTGRGERAVRVVVGRAVSVVSVVRAVRSTESRSRVVSRRGVLLVLRRRVVGARKSSRGSGVVACRSKQSKSCYLRSRQEAQAYRAWRWRACRWGPGCGHARECRE
jgi:hypothetical protein